MGLFNKKNKDTTSSSGGNSHLKISMTKDGSEYTFLLEGRLNTITSPALESKINEVIGNATKLTIDLAKLEYISSAGLRVLLRIRKTKPSMRIVNVSSEVYEILDMTGFTEMMTVEKAYRVVSIEGCEEIGRGANGKLYRIDQDNVVKVYKNAEKVFGKGGKDDLKEMTDCDIPFEPDKKVEKGKQSFKHRKEPVEKFYESYTGTLFESTGGDVNGAIDRAYDIMKRDPKHMLNFNKFLSLLGLPDVPAGTNVGFRTGYCDLSVSTKLVMINGEEVVGIFYDEDPCSGYDSKRIY